MNWSVYNDWLVRRGEILLDFSVLDLRIGIKRLDGGATAGGGDLSHTQTP